MKVLMVSSFLPYPLYSGGHVRLFNLIKELSGKHDITLVCEKRDSQSVDDIEEVEKICKEVITVNRKKQWTAGNIFKSLSSPNSFLVTGHTHKEMREKIQKKLENNNFDLIHVETFYVMQNLPDYVIARSEATKQSIKRDRHALRARDDIGGAPVVLAEHNIEYQVYQKYSDDKNLILRQLLEYDIAKIKREEERSWQKATKLIAVSEIDAKVMEKKDLKPVIVSNGVDTQKFSAKNKAANTNYKKILFIGDFKWIQNRDAAKFIINDIWPQIKLKLNTENIKLKLWIVGKKIPDSLKSLTTDLDVLFDEKSSAMPTEGLFQEADVLLAPIRVGGGTSYKVLESMSSGTPVVTTELSANAIGAEDGKNIMIGKTAEELAKKTLNLLSDEKLYSAIRANGRKLIEENYTWKKIANDLENVYKSLV